MSEPANQPVVSSSVPTSDASAMPVPSAINSVLVADQQQPSQDDPLQTVAPSLPQFVQQNTDTLNPAQAVGGTTAKEAAGISLERPQFDAVTSGQVTEVEPGREMEMPPEVDGYLKKVASDQGQLPQEVVIVNDPAAPPPTKFLAKPVIILPITAEMEKAGKRKSVKKSFRWLVEWSERVIKMFNGSVIYRENTN